MQFHRNPLDTIVITQQFGISPATYRRFGLPGHNGIDLRTRFWDSPFGHRECYAILDGKVREIRWDRTGYGFHVRVDHAEGWMTLYAHLRRISVARGQEIRAGDVIGITDSTGFSFGHHLHFELRAPGWEQKGPKEYYGAVDAAPYFLATR